MLHELQLQVLAIMRGHADASLRAQAGEFDHNPAAGIVRLKPGELWGRAIERGIVTLIPSLPQATERDWEEMSTEEKEAFMRGEYKRRKAEGA
jgi:hypothetical protein